MAKASWRAAVISAGAAAPLAMRAERVSCSRRFSRWKSPIRACRRSAKYTPSQAIAVSRRTASSAAASNARSRSMRAPAICTRASRLARLGTSCISPRRCIVAGVARHAVAVGPGDGHVLDADRQARVGQAGRRRLRRGVRRERGLLRAQRRRIQARDLERFAIAQTRRRLRPLARWRQPATTAQVRKFDEQHSRGNPPTASDSRQRTKPGRDRRAPAAGWV